MPTTPPHHYYVLRCEPQGGGTSVPIISLNGRLRQAIGQAKRDPVNSGVEIVLYEDVHTEEGEALICFGISDRTSPSRNARKLHEEYAARTLRRELNKAAHEERLGVVFREPT